MNINSYVKVKLTEKGFKVYKNYIDKINELNKNRLKTLSTDDVGLIVEKTMCEYYLTNFCKNKAKGEENVF